MKISFHSSQKTIHAYHYLPPILNIYYTYLVLLFKEIVNRKLFLTSINSCDFLIHRPPHPHIYHTIHLNMFPPHKLQHLPVKYTSSYNVGFYYSRNRNL